MNDDSVGRSAPTTRFSERRLLTVIAEAVLEDRLLHDMHRWGVGGFTVVRAEGDPFGSRVGDLEGAFLRIECVVGDAVAETVLTELEKRYFDRFKVVAYDHPVRVVRASKFP